MCIRDRKIRQRGRFRCLPTVGFAIACALIVSGCGLEQPGSPVSISDRSLSERMEARQIEIDRTALAEAPADVLATSGSSPDTETPAGLAFAEDTAPDLTATDAPPKIGLDGGRLQMVGVGVGLNIRQGPGQGYDVVFQIPAGQELEDRGAVTGEWAFISFDGVEGLSLIHISEPTRPY